MLCDKCGKPIPEQDWDTHEHNKTCSGQLNQRISNEPIVAYRVWNTIDSKSFGIGVGQIPNNTYYLAPIAMGNVSYWLPKDKYEAECQYFERYANKADHRMSKCSCGIYCFKELDNAIAMLPTPHLGYSYVLGAIYIWGRVLQLELGYHAEYAKLKELYIPEDIFPKFSTEYKCTRKLIMLERYKIIGNRPKLVTPGKIAREDRLRETIREVNELGLTIKNLYVEPYSGNYLHEIHQERRKQMIRQAKLDKINKLNQALLLNSKIGGTGNASS